MVKLSAGKKQELKDMYSLNQKMTLSAARTYVLQKLSVDVSLSAIKTIVNPSICKGEGGGKFPMMEARLRNELSAMAEAESKSLDELVYDQDARLSNEALCKRANELLRDDPKTRLDYVKAQGWAPVFKERFKLRLRDEKDRIMRWFAVSTTEDQDEIDLMSEEVKERRLQNSEASVDGKASVTHQQEKVHDEQQEEEAGGVSKMRSLQQELRALQQRQDDLGNYSTENLVRLQSRQEDFEAAVATKINESGETS
ncbi:hypothetical protein PInf_026100 [Phytophthora infestans]|nr:hypothetical protein PInf_026100 [Phytophthora infestans]